MQEKISMDAAHDFEAKMPLSRKIPLGLQHVFAMFVGNLTPLLIIMGACGIAGGEFADLQVSVLQNAMFVAGVVTLVQLFSIEPKSFAELPPPKELMPTEISDRPILSTTVPVTTAGKNLRSGLRKKPSTVSNRPPRMDAPIIAPYAITPPPMVAATLLNTPIKPHRVLHRG